MFAQIVTKFAAKGAARWAAGLWLHFEFASALMNNVAGAAAAAKFIYVYIWTRYAAAAPWGDACALLRGGNSANFHSSNEDKMQIRNTIYLAGAEKLYFAWKWNCATAFAILI